MEKKNCNKMTKTEIKKSELAMVNKMVFTLLFNTPLEPSENEVKELEDLISRQSKIRLSLQKEGIEANIYNCHYQY